MTFLEFANIMHNIGNSHTVVVALYDIIVVSIY